ncbi:MAG TPA: preprotein translocase subunit YajC [Gemmatimonadaceae bacterium]|jgi:preprotein translocase subunit YajC|nr:preprotein translocase subunit YajC [Gemmatimonadaceae bacterium]
MQNNFLITMIIEIGAIGTIFYFLLLRPQQKKREEHEATLRSLKKGDEIITAGGIIGEVVFIAQQSKDGTPTASMDDRITIKSGETRLIVERGRVARVLNKTGVTEAKL